MQRYVEAARSHAAIGEYRQALDNLGRALRTAPRDPALWSQIAEVLAQDEEIEEAIDAYDHVTDLAPKDALAHFQKGVLLAQIGRREEAHRAIATSIELSPEYVREIERAHAHERR
jgi:Flp pilus assembly protein TadD